MKYTEMKKKVLALIEELDAGNENLTDDPDIQAKILEVINQVMFELARMKKIPKYAEIEVEEGETLDFETIGNSVGYELYQIEAVSGVKHQMKAAGTVVKVLEAGTAEIECFVYPEQITEKNSARYEFELSADALEVMPYGVAADLLKSDVSSSYGQVYSNRYETMLQRLDSRYDTGQITVEGGYDI